MAAAYRITSRNARFQQWQSFLTNRNKRQRAGAFLVQGARPLQVAVDRGWPVRTLIHADRRSLARWAQELLDGSRAERVAMAPELLAELGEKDDGPPELVGVVELPPDDLTRLPLPHGGPDDFLGVLLDRPTSPGNIGSAIRSADAFGAHGVVIAGHAADPYDPKAVRASTGSVFALPTVRTSSPSEVLHWLRGPAQPPVTVIGTDEDGTADLMDTDLTGPVLLLVGNETRGLSNAWREQCDQLVRIPMAARSASSLNAANAATTVLYEAFRQRHVRLQEAV